MLLHSGSNWQWCILPIGAVWGHFEAVFECVGQFEVGQSETHFGSPWISTTERTFEPPVPEPLNQFEPLMAYFWADILDKKLSHWGLFYSNYRGRSRRKRWLEPIFAIWTGRLCQSLSRTIQVIEPCLRYVWKAHFMAVLQGTHTLGLPRILPQSERVKGVI